MVCEVYAVHRGRCGRRTPRLVRVIPVVFIPSPPLLLPSLNPHPLAIHDRLRDVVLEACKALTSAEEVVVIGGPSVGQRPDHTGYPTGVTLYPPDLPGCEDRFQGRPPGEGAELPLSLTVGRWALRAAGHPPEGSLTLALAAGSPAEIRTGLQSTDQVRLGPRSALLVVGDGTAGRHEKAPLHVVAGAAELDDRLAMMLADADLGGIMRLPTELDIEFGLDGRSAWQAAAVLLAQSGAAVRSARLLDYSDPHHVAYFVARWDAELPV